MIKLSHEIKYFLVIISMLTNFSFANAQDDFNSDLPLILITHTGGLTSSGHQISEVTIIDIDPVTQRATITDDPDFVGPMGYKIRGSSSAGFPRKQYSMETWDDNMEDLDVSLLGFPEESDWVLYAPGQFDRALINNPLIYHLGNKVGVYSPRTKFVEMFINDEYRGIYVLVEKVKRGKDRTDVEKLTSEDNAEPEITGGYMMSIDRSYEGQTRWSTPTQSNINHVYPKHTNITTQQKDYIRNYVNEFDQVLSGANWLDPIDGYIKYVDLDSWIDYHLIKNMAHEVDMLRLSTYFHKERGGKLKYGPIWDNDRALNSTDSRDDNTNTWSYYRTYGWWNKLFQDKNFETAYFDRWFHLRENELSTTNLEILIDSLAAEVTEATTRYNYSFRYGSFNGEIAQLKVWLQARCEWLDGEFARPPVFSQNGGIIPNNFQLTITNPNNQGTIYYTLDGSDPRLPGGGISPNALVYNGVISLNNITKVIARVQIGNNDWGAKKEEIFFITQPYSNIAINEIHYYPQDSIISGDTISGKNFEFIEIINKGNDLVNLSELTLSKGIDFDFEFGTILQPNEFLVFGEDSDRFEDRYGFAPDGIYSGKLENDGEKIILSDPFGNIIDSVRYYNSDPWDEAPDSSGYSLELLHPSLNNDEPLNWFRSDNIGGTPKAENSRICAQAGEAIVINEINYNSNNDVLDPGNWVELHNSTDNPIDLSGWTFYDSGSKFILPQGTNIPAEGYLVLVENQNDFIAAFPNVNVNKVVGEFPFGLSKKGERISLFDQNKCLADYVIYNDKDPWPETPDGDGPTLSLLDNALDNTLPSSWEASDIITTYFENGSPGQSNNCSPGQSCDDGDPCSINDVFDVECNCIGVLMPEDDDNDGVCNIADQCPNFDDNLIGTPCDDGNICTINDTYNDSCNCIGTYVDNDNDGVCDVEDICPLLENNLLGQLCDDGDPLTDFDTYNSNTCSCSGIIVVETVCSQISISEDDAEELIANGVVTLASGDLDMINDEGELFLVGLRFQNINVPQGKTIEGAFIQFAADEINSEITNLTIRAEATDNAVAFSAVNNNISTRVTTIANVTWQPDPWAVVGDNLAAQKTIDLSPIIQEVVNRPGFSQGNSISIIIEGTGIRTAESFDGSALLAPELCISFNNENCVENYPCDDGDPCTVNEYLDADCNCTGGIFQDSDNDGTCDAEDICPNLDDNLFGQLCDDGNPLTDFDTYNSNTCGCSGIIASGTLCTQVSSSEDDAEEQVDNSVVTLTSGDLDMANDEGVIYLSGLRFQNINIPQGAEISNATIQFAADEINSEVTNLTIRGEATDNSIAFTATDNNISNRSTTVASVTWQPDPWAAVGDNSDAQKTIDLSPIIQEIINRPGFSQGNSISIIIEGTGTRTAESFDGSALLAPELCITFSTGACVENYPCDDGNVNTINDVFDENCDCVGELVLLNAKILLEGFYDDENNNMHTLLNDKDLIPLSQPYNVAPWNYAGNENVSSIPAGVVDWILLITRDVDGNILNQSAGFVNQTGEIMNIDGTLGIPAGNSIGNTFSIHHRTHLAVLSANHYDGGMYDFTTSENQAEGNAQLKFIDEKYMLHAGDYDGEGIINNLDFNYWKTQGAVINQYLPIDGDGNGIINSLDYNLWTNNKSKVGHPFIRY